MQPRTELYPDALQAIKSSAKLLESKLFKILNQSQALSFAFDMQSLMFQVSAFDGTGLDDLNMEASALNPMSQFLCNEEKTRRLFVLEVECKVRGLLEEMTKAIQSFHGNFQFHEKC